MKLVMTLLVRDEEDVLSEQLEYHLNAGVDFVVATDHRSEDGTTEILESYARQGVLALVRESGAHSRQGEWQTGMSRRAATEFAADWVIPSDSDEFWMPRGPSLKEALLAVPERYGVVCGLVQNFVPRHDDSGWFVERLTVRLSPDAPINDPATPFRPVVKVAHRAGTRVVVPDGGAHQIFGLDRDVLRAWYPLDVLHMPLRSRSQLARKYRKTWTGWELNLRGDLARARQVSDEGRPDAMWDRVALDDAGLRRGLAEGWLVTDVRLRDAFCELRRSGAAAPVTPPELASHAFEAAVFDEAEVVRFQRWVDEIERRVSSLEDRPRVRAR
jgi:hypothetical protein